MKVISAEAMGICFGVRDALGVMRGVEVPAQVTVRGELVHNPVVMGELRGRGFRVMGEGEEGLPGTGVVMVTAHGVSDAERGRWERAGKRIVDTTCPLVRRAHRAAVGLGREGYFVVVVGKRGHVEVRGLTGDLSCADFVVVESMAEVRTFGWAKIGVLAQTTSVEREVFEIVERVRVMNVGAEVRFVNTVCGPTRERQIAVERLLRQIDVLVVVGGRASNNTLHLVQRAREHGMRCLHVQDDTEVREGDFVGNEIVGLTAGTSTLPETIEAVRGRLVELYSDRNA